MIALSLFLAFLVGLFVNQVFAMLSRLLPPTWARYQVRIGSLHDEVTMGFRNWTAEVHIGLPTRWRRILMQPAREYLLAEVKLKGQDWVRSEWVEGDVNILRLLADGMMSVSAQVFTECGGKVYLSNSYPERPLIEDEGYDVRLRVVRSYHHEVADEVGIFIVKGVRHLHATIER